MSRSRFLLLPAPALGLAPVSADVAGVAWRLLAGNNSELGRCAVATPDATACAEAVAHLQSSVAGLEFQLVDGAAGRWGWRASLAGEPVATSSRWYLRQRESRYNLEGFRLAVPQARLVRGSQRATHRGRAP